MPIAYFFGNLGGSLSPALIKTALSIISSSRTARVRGDPFVAEFDNVIAACMHISGVTQPYSKCRVSLSA